MAKSKKSRLGETHIIGNDKITIIEYNTASDITILYEDGHTQRTRYSHVVNGMVRNVNSKDVFGIGYFGEKTEPYSKKTYDCWYNMLERCYSPNRKDYEAYKDCEVCEEWHCFQNFAKWWNEVFYIIDGESMEIDKDILIKGNKLYSPNTCSIVPKRINLLFSRSHEKRDLPVGVKLGKNSKYTVRVTNAQGKRVYIGEFKNESEAFLAYKKAKEEVIKEVAELYKPLIPEEVYKGMINYKINDSDWRL